MSTSADLGKCLAFQVCPQCKHVFRLTWNDYSTTSQRPQTLHISSCPSGGIYDVSISCPHCNYHEAL